MTDSMRYVETTGVPSEDTLTDLVELFKLVFNDGRHDEFIAALKAHQRVHCVFAYDTILAGFKIGYEQSPGVFHSWLGGVHPDCCNRGIGTELMRRQHVWCRSQGYQSVQTRSMNRWREMLILNLKHGFDVVRVETDKRGDQKILMEKYL